MININHLEDAIIDDQRKQLIREGLDNGIDVSFYADERFSFFQMCEIRDGLYSGVDVSSYAIPTLSWRQMQQKRFQLETEKDAANEIFER